MQAQSFFLGGVPMIFTATKLVIPTIILTSPTPAKATITVGCTGPLLTGKK